VDTQVIIDNYIQDVANRLPRRLRNDVGMELRGLLAEQLDGAARDAGRAADGALAIEVLRRFGRPEDVAARYAPQGFELVAPELAPWFLRLATACVAVQWALTLPRLFSSAMTFAQWWPRWGFGAFAWVGVLLVWFGAATWVRRQSPVNPQSLSRPWTHWIFWVPSTTDWRPVDRVAAERRAATGAFPLGVAAALFFIAPAWFIGLFAAAGVDTSWALYDANFSHWLLLPVIALMTMRLALFAVAINARWRAPTEAIRFGLWVGFVALLIWALVGWRIFAHPVTDSLFKAWLSIFLLVNTIQIIVWLRRQATRVRVPGSLADLK
jgi:hypothetical protein